MVVCVVCIAVAGKRTIAEGPLSHPLIRARQQSHSGTRAHSRAPLGARIWPKSIRPIGYESMHTGRLPPSLRPGHENHASSHRRVRVCRRMVCRRVGGRYGRGSEVYVRDGWYGDAGHYL